jgi:hypothetical protein
LFIVLVFHPLGVTLRGTGSCVGTRKNHGVANGLVHESEARQVRRLEEKRTSHRRRTSQGAAERDLEGGERADDTTAPDRGGGAIPYYDIGAFEFGSAAGALTVVRSDNEMGRVTSTPPGIDCGRQCWVAFTIGAEINAKRTPLHWKKVTALTGD